MCVSFKSASVLTRCPRLWPLSGVCSKREIHPGREIEKKREREAETAIEEVKNGTKMASGNNLGFAHLFGFSPQPVASVPVWQGERLHNYTKISSTTTLLFTMHHIKTKSWVWGCWCPYRNIIISANTILFLSARIKRGIGEPVLTFVCLKYVHRVSNLQWQLLLSPGVVVIDCWRRTRGDNIRGGDITGGGGRKKKAIKCLAPLWC